MLQALLYGQLRVPLRDPTDACGAIGAVSGGIHDAFGVGLAQGGDEVLALSGLYFSTDAGIGREVGGVGPLERRDERRFVGYVAPDNPDASLGRAVAAGERIFRVSARTRIPQLSSAFVVAPPCFPVAPITRTVDLLMTFEGSPVL